MISGEFDVVVVGAGNAGMCAALAARGEGARVLVLEAAPFDERGGNSRFTAGALRFVYNGVEDLLKLCDLSETELATSDFGTYTQDKYYDDLGRLTDYRSNPDMAELLVTKSQETLLWMRSQGIRFAPMYSRQAFKHEGKFVFWGGLALEAWGGGPGLVEGLFKAAEERQIQIAYEARGEQLIADDDGVHGVIAKVEGKTTRIPAKAIVLACGGFEANAEMRTRYLGPGWDLAKVRGTRFNTGAGIKMALDIGAMPYGNWSGCHAVGSDYNAPEFGHLAVGDNFQKHSYPFAIIVNADGVRFCDEGADFRNYTYAKYGRLILEQPHQFAWQIFDQQTVHLAARRIPHPSGHQGHRRHDRGFGRQNGRIRPGQQSAVSRNDPRVQCRGPARHTLQPDDQGWAHHQGSGDRQDQLGDADRETALRGLLHDLRRHLYVWRIAHRHRRAGARYRAAADTPAFTPRASWLAASSLSIIQAAPASFRARCLARSPEPRPPRTLATAER